MANKVNSAIGIEYNSHEIKAVELLKRADGSLQAKPSALSAIFLCLSRLFFLNVFTDI